MEQPVEYHPWEPFTPDGAVVLFVGTFPPARSRWAMDFYYPNRINDFWRIMGLIFKGDKNALLTPDLTGYRLDEIKQLLTERHIALSDTGLAIRRLAGNASDKFLEIVEQRDIPRARRYVARLPLHSPRRNKSLGSRRRTNLDRSPENGRHRQYKARRSPDNDSPHALDLACLPHETREESRLLPQSLRAGRHPLTIFS